MWSQLDCKQFHFYRRIYIFFNYLVWDIFKIVFFSILHYYSFVVHYKLIKNGRYETIMAVILSLLVNMPDTRRVLWSRLDCIVRSWRRAFFLIIIWLMGEFTYQWTILVDSTQRPNGSTQVGPQIPSYNHHTWSQYSESTEEAFIALIKVCWTIYDGIVENWRAVSIATHK